MSGVVAAHQPHRYQPIMKDEPAGTRALAYVIVLFVLLAVLGWQPNGKHKTQSAPQSVSVAAPAAAR